MHLQKLTNKIIEYGFYALFALTPFVFNISRTFPSFELFEWNKMMFVYTLTVLIAGSWSIRMILNRKIIFAKTPFTFPLLLFLLSQVLSTFFSIDPHVSFWGYYSRFHGGLLSITSYTLLFFAFVSNRDLISLSKLFAFTLISGAGVGAYGILEKFGIDAHMWVQDVRARVFSTLGQPNWLAAYLTILLPISISYFFKIEQANNTRRAEFSILNFKFSMKISNFKFQIINQKTFCLFLTVLFYTCLLFTRSRSGFLGFWTANSLFWVALFYSSSERSESRSSIRRKFSTSSNSTIFKTFLLLNFSFLILNFFLSTPFPQYNRVASIEAFQSAPTPLPPPPSTDTIIDVGITDSAKIRSIVWKGAIDIVKAYPLFGTGPETFAYSYYKFRPAQHNLTSEWDFLYNRAHNEFLNVAATSGLIGLGSYLFFIGTVLFWFIKFSILNFKFSMKISNFKFQIGEEKRALQNNYLHSLGLFAGWISILVTNFFGFSVVIVGLFFFLIPAFLYALHHPTTHEFEEEKIRPLSLLGTGIIGLFMFLGLLQLGVLWFADSIYAKSVSFGRLESYPQAYDQINTALTLRRDEPNYYDHKASVATNLALLSLESGDSTRSSQYALEAVEMSQIALSISPQNVNFWKTRTKVFFFLSEIDASFIDDAITSIRIARELAPTDAKIAYNEAVILGRAGRNAEAILALEQAIELKPDYRNAYVALSIFYKEEGQNEKAKEVLELVLERINPNDEEIKQRLEELK